MLKFLKMLSKEIESYTKCGGKLVRNCGRWPSCCRIDDTSSSNGWQGAQNVPFKKVTLLGIVNGLPLTDNGIVEILNDLL